MNPKPSVVLWRDIYDITEKVCGRFGLRYGKIIPDTRKQARDFGITYACDKCLYANHIDETNCNEKIIAIRIHQLKDKSSPLSTSTILRTLAHELAHIRYWYHGPKHKYFEKQIVEYIKELGYII